MSSLFTYTGLYLGLAGEMELPSIIVYAIGLAVVLYSKTLNKLYPGNHVFKKLPAGYCFLPSFLFKSRLWQTSLSEEELASALAYADRSRRAMLLPILAFLLSFFAVIVDGLTFRGPEEKWEPVPEELQMYVHPDAIDARYQAHDVNWGGGRFDGMIGHEIRFHVLREYPSTDLESFYGDIFLEQGYLKGNHTTTKWDADEWKAHRPYRYNGMYGRHIDINFHWTHIELEKRATLDLGYKMEIKDCKPLWKMCKQERLPSRPTDNKQYVTLVIYPAETIAPKE